MLLLVELIDVFLIMVLIFSLGAFFLIVPRIFLYLPFVPTPMSVVNKMIEMASLEGNEVVYDLGAGDCRFLIEVKKRFSNTTTKGCELAPMIYLYGKLHVFFSKQDIDLQLKSSFKMDVHDADVLFLYLIPPHMKAMGEKFDRELKKGTKVLSHAFAFPDRTPVMDISIPYKKRTKRILMYEW